MTVRTEQRTETMLPIFGIECFCLIEIVQRFAMPPKLTQYGSPIF